MFPRRRTDGLNVSVRRHTVYNFLGSVLPLAVSLATTPIYLRLVGEERYGFLAIAWLLLGYFGLFDFGLSRATAQKIAATPEPDREGRAVTFWTALTMNFGLGVVGGLVLWPLAWYLTSHVLKLDPALRQEAGEATLWLALGVPMITVAAVLSGTLQGRTRFLELNLITGGGTLLFHVVPLLAAAWISPSLGVILPVALAMRLVAMAALFQRCHHHIGSPSQSFFSRNIAGGLLRFGGWVSISAVLSPIMVLLDRLVLGATLGARAVSYYTIPFQLADRSTLLARAMASALFPRLAAASGEEARRLSDLAIQSLILLMTPAVVIGTLVFEPFLRIWISDAFAREAALLGEILLFGCWINSFARVPYAQLQARGRPDLVAKCHLIELPLYLAALFLGLHFFGLPGAALAFSLRVTADFIALSHLAGCLQAASRRLPIPAMLVAAAVGLASSPLKHAPAYLLLGSALLAMTCVWCFFAMPLDIRAEVAARLRLRVAKTPAGQ